MATETPREIVKRCMPHVKYEHVDGVMYQTFGSSWMPSETHEILMRLEFNADDVFSTGWSRSGNHWTYYVLDMILKQEATLTRKRMSEAFPDCFSKEQLGLFNETPSPRLVLSHLRPQKFPDVARKNTRVIYVIRNPKDALVSCYKLRSSYTQEHQFNGTWDEFFEATLAGEMVFGTWIDHVLDFEKFMADNPNVPVYIHQFEEMKQKPVECVKKLCAFLGQPDTLAEEIVANSSIDSIKEIVNSELDENLRYFKGKTSQFINKGEIGNWKSHFTVAQNEIFDQEFEKKMKGSKLAELVRQYI